MTEARCTDKLVMAMTTVWARLTEEVGRGLDRAGDGGRVPPDAPVCPDGKRTSVSGEPLHPSSPESKSKHCRCH